MLRSSSSRIAVTSSWRCDVVQIIIELKGIEELLRKTAAPASWLGPALRTMLTKSALAVESNAKKLVPVDTGTLRRTITHPVAGGLMPLVATVGTNAPYAVVVHEGRRAGAPAPPSGKLLSWMSRHGMDPKSAFVVARAIGRKGIKGRPFLKNGFEASRSAIDGYSAAFQRDVEIMWGKK